ncbi:MAG: S41 family peptidase [Erythrobacter sp.]
MQSATVLSKQTLSILGAAAAFFATPVFAQSAPQDRWLSVDAVQSDIALAQEAYERVHPGYTRYASEAEMNAAWAGIVARAQTDGGMRLADFYLAVERVLTHIRCDHTKAELPRAMREARLGQPLYLPFRWQLVGGRGLIRTADPATGLRRGDEIVAIDGRSLEDMVAAVSSYIPVDGYTEWSRNAGVSESLEFMGGALDHFGMLLWGAPEIARIAVRDAEGGERLIEVPRIAFDAWTQLSSQTEGAGATNFADAVHFETLTDDVGYLKVDTFVNYRNPVDPNAVFEPIFNALAEQGSSTLILDLRQNGGGSTDAAQALARHLLEETQALKLSMSVATLDLSGLREHLTTWDARALNPDPRGFIAQDDGMFTLRDGIADDTAVLEPADAAFQGRLIILTSNSNSSGSTNLLAVLSQQDRTTLIGEPTGGSAEGPTAGIQFTLTLPQSGVRTRIPVFRFRNNVQSFEIGMGLSPDIAASMTVADFRARRDPALDMALALAKGDDVDPAAQFENSVATVDDFAIVAGEDWSGTLEYLNYNSDARSTIPVRLVAREPQGRTMRYGIAYPGEEDKNANDRLRVSRDGTQINGYAIVQRFTDPERGTVLVTQGTGRDDNRPADIRLTYEIAADRFVISKDVRFADGEWINRNSYRLQR